MQTALLRQPEQGRTEGVARAIGLREEQGISRGDATCAYDLEARFQQLLT